MKTGFTLQMVEGDAVPITVCESCGEPIRDCAMAWVMWDEGAEPKPEIEVLCKTNGCISKPPYKGFASMELREYLINLCRNAGMVTEEHFHEALEFARMSEEI
jgi:hypothetical protein